MTEQFWMYDRRSNLLRERNILRERNLYNMTKAWKYIARAKDGGKTTHNRHDHENVLPTAMDNPAFSSGDMKHSPETIRINLNDRTSPLSSPALSPLSSPAKERQFKLLTKYEDRQPRNLLRENFNLRRSRDSLRSSTASIPEVIEECSSDDENSEEEKTTTTTTTTNVDYMNCINCSLSKSSTSIDSTTSDPFITQGMNTCYRCRHLSQSKDRLSIPNIPMKRLNRPLSWSAGDWATSSPQRLRRTGLSVSSELPSISESCDESEGDEELTENNMGEFHKSNSSIRRRTIDGGEVKNEAKNIRRINRRFRSVRKNFDFV